MHGISAGGEHHGEEDHQLGRGVILLIGMLLASAPAAAALHLHHYTVSVDDELAMMNVHACFAGPPPQVLVVESLDAPGAFVEGKVAKGGHRDLAPNGTEMRLKDVPVDGCIDYSVNLHGGPTRQDFSGNSTRRVGRDLFTEIGLWFWRPATLAPDEDIVVDFDLPKGLSVSAPWEPVAPIDGRPAYRVGHGPYDRPAAVAIGHFHEVLLDVPGAQLRLSVLDGSPPADLHAMSEWIQDAARSVAEVYGRFPVPNPQILVMPGARASEPTPWAYVLRGGQGAAHFFVNQRRKLGDFVEDWTAAHELSHLLLPYVKSQDAWLSEGLATYYQNVVRARSGAISPADAWQRMHSGFLRAMRLARPGRTLAQATDRMFGSGGYMRVYWQGAAILLLADVQLRERSGGTQSLDTVLDRFGACCLDPDAEWTARRVFEKFDELSGTDIFSTLYDREVSSPAFTDLSPLYRDLGLVALGGKVELAPDAPGGAVRDAIMAPGPYQTPRALIGDAR
ncbi:MAG: hypothetical protein GC151_19570 [Betaproteobacteria bacterium]|nr:hypothetical protein [Betaproteobacteria bacterium]